MSGAGAVVALVLVEWATGWVAVAAWNQTWQVVRRGHFRITAWIVVALAALMFLAVRAAVPDGAWLVVSAAGSLVAGVAYLLAQYLRSDLVGAGAGALAGACGVATLVAAAGELPAWATPVAAVHLFAGALLLGGVTNGMMLGHWYLNQPGLQPWALARLTQVALAGVAASLLVGALAWRSLATAETEGAVLGLPGFGANFGGAFYVVWVVLICFTGAVVWGARRCVAIRSIQSATGLYYAALLGAGVSEFLVRYLMVNST